MNKLGLRLWNLAQKYNNKLGLIEGKNYVIGLIFYKYISDKEKIHLNEILANENLNFDEAYGIETYKTLLKERSLEKLGYFLNPSLLFDNIVYKIINDEFNKNKGNNKKNNEGNNKGKNKNNNSKNKNSKNKNNDNELFKLDVLKRTLNNIENSTNKYDVEDIFLEIFDEINESIDENIIKEDIIKENSINGNSINGNNIKDNNPNGNNINGNNITDVIKDLILEINDIDFFNENSNFPKAFGFLINQYSFIENKNNTHIPFEINNLLRNILKIENKNIENKNRTHSVYSSFGNPNILNGLAKSIGISKIYSEVDKENYNLSRMNMIVNGYDFDIRIGNLENPQFLKNNWKFDFVIGSFPFSARWSSDKKFLMDDRFFEAEILPPKTRAYFAHVLHMLHLLSKKGIMIAILPSGVLFREGSEKTIREYLIKKNYIDTIIEIPLNIFNGLKRSTIVMILKKNRENDSNNKILFLDASKNFKKLKNSNILRKKDIKNITEIYSNKFKSDKYQPSNDSSIIKHFSEINFSLVDIEEIIANNYNLNISRYINNSKEEDIDSKSIIKEIDVIDQKLEAIDEEIKKYSEKLNINKLLL